ncbi:Uncharacterised protein [Klebsiella pneumoniae]|nr:Uncharacterised protein [Klebsiella pneumoniae]
MSGNQVPAILNAGLALKHTFRQVAQHRSQGRHHRTDQQHRRRDVKMGPHAVGPGNHCRGQQTAKKALPGFTR